MGNLVIPAAPAKEAQAIFDIYCAHNSGLRIHTDTTIQAALLSRYPSHSLASTTCDLIKYAHAGHAVATLAHPTLRSCVFEPSVRQSSGEIPAGSIKQAVSFGRYDYTWQGYTFQVFVVDGQCDRRWYVLSQPSTKADKEQIGNESTEALILAASIWFEQIHEQVWVYDQGRWSKNSELWRMVRGTSWDDLILDERAKSAIMRDVVGFFDAKETYAEFGMPWKRGLIFHGSPGNGKTSTAKALMKALMARPKPVPTLVVKTLAQRGFGPQVSVRQIFTKARQTAPCLLLFEDIDSLVTDQVRSYFFNEVDGLEDNDGILMIASTNNLDKLDPGLSKRPSRFDRKYRFNNPSYEDRIRYCGYWSKKLSSRPAAALSSTAAQQIASITDGFSFAYLKETYVASLLTLARNSAEEVVLPEDEDDCKWGKFGKLLQQQATSLKEEIAAKGERK